MGFFKKALKVAAISILFVPLLVPAMAVGGSLYLVYRATKYAAKNKLKTFLLTGLIAGSITAYRHRNEIKKWVGDNIFLQNYYNKTEQLETGYKTGINLEDTITTDDITTAIYKAYSKLLSRVDEYDGSRCIKRAKELWEKTGIEIPYELIMRAYSKLLSRVDEYDGSIYLERMDELKELQEEIQRKSK